MYMLYLPFLWPFQSYIWFRQDQMRDTILLYVVWWLLVHTYAHTLYSMYKPHISTPGYFHAHCHWPPILDIVCVHWEYSQCVQWLNIPHCCSEPVQLLSSPSTVPVSLWPLLSLQLPTQHPPSPIPLWLSHPIPLFTPPPKSPLPAQVTWPAVPQLCLPPRLCLLRSSSLTPVSFFTSRSTTSPSLSVSHWHLAVCLVHILYCSRRCNKLWVQLSSFSLVGYGIILSMCSFAADSSSYNNLTGASFDSMKFLNNTVWSANKKFTLKRFYGTKDKPVYFILVSEHVLLLALCIALISCAAYFNLILYTVSFWEEQWWWMVPPKPSAC